MHLTIADRIRFTYRSFELWSGLLALVVGAGLADSASWGDACFYLGLAATAPGHIVTTYPTTYTINDATVQGFTYRYQIAGLEWAGNSFSADSTIRPGQAALVEYLPGRPALSRLQGTSTSPLGTTGLLVAGLLIAGGLVLMLRSILRTRRQLAVVVDATLTKAIRQRVIKQADAEYTTFEMQYQYAAAYRQYTLTVTAREADHYHPQELLAYEQATPANALLVRSLPAFIRARLLADA